MPRPGNFNQIGRQQPAPCVNVYLQLDCNVDHLSTTLANDVTVVGLQTAGAVFGLTGLTVHLPLAASVPRARRVLFTDEGANVTYGGLGQLVAIAASGSDSIVGSVTFHADGASIELYSDGVDTWFVCDTTPTAGSTGTVTSVSVTTANGVSGSVATATTTPAITLTLGAITPTTVNGVTITGSGTLATGTFTLTVSGTANVSGTHSGTSSNTNTGDQTITLTGDVTGSGTGSFAATIAAPYGNTFGIRAQKGLTTRTQWGMSVAPATNGTITSADDTTTSGGVFQKFATSASTNANAYILTNSTLTVLNWSPDVEFHIQTGSSLADYSLFVGWSSSGSSGDLSAVNCAGLVYDTGQDGTAFWRMVTSDGAAQNRVASSQSIAVSTTYRIRVQCTPTLVSFYVGVGNGTPTLVGTSAAHLPTATTALSPYVYLETLANAAKFFLFGWENGKQV